MNLVLRGLMWVEDKELEGATSNIKDYFVFDRLLSVKSPGREVIEFCLEFFTQWGEAPALKVVFANFEKANNYEAVALIEEIAKETLCSGASFKSLFEDLVEESAKETLMGVLKGASRIASVGV